MDDLTILLTPVTDIALTMTAAAQNDKELTLRIAKLRPDAVQLFIADNAEYRFLFQSVVWHAAVTLRLPMYLADPLGYGPHGIKARKAYLLSGKLTCASFRLKEAG
jgi:hypothetical protein